MSYPMNTTQAPLTPGYQAGYYQQPQPAYAQAPAYPRQPVYQADSYQASYQQPYGGYPQYGYQQPMPPYPQQPYGYPPTYAPEQQGVSGFGALIASLVSLFKRPKAQPQAPAPYANVSLPDRNQVSDEAFVTDLYRRLLGREPDAGGFQAHLNGLRSGTSRQDLVRIFTESPEYRERQAGLSQGMPLPTGPVDFQLPQAVMPQPSVAPMGPTAPLEGFDFNKLANPNHRTPKYLFARTVQNVSLSSVHDKASAEQLLRSIRPRLEAAGLRILDVKGDKIQVVTELGAEWVDVIARSGASNPAWWWGSEGVGTPVAGLPAR